jgi:MFS family permease
MNHVRTGPLPAAGWRSAISSLENRQFRWLWSGNVAFFFAMQSMSMVLRTSLTYQLTHGDPYKIGQVTFVVAIPMVLLAPLGGVLADRMDRRRLIAMCQGILLASEGTTCALFSLGILQFWHLLALGTVIGTMFALMMPARQAIVVNVVGRAQLGNALALNMTGMNVTRVVGPAAAGVAMSAVGITPTYAVGLGLYALALFAMTRLEPALPPPGSGRPPVLRSIAEGFRYLGSHRMVLLLIVFGVAPMLLMMPFQPLLVIFANDVWHSGYAGLGWLNAAAGIGGMAGAFLVAVRGEADRRLGMMLLSVLGFAGTLGAFAFCPWFGVAMGLLLFANVFASVFSVLNNTAIQQLVPDEVRGRISSFLTMSFSLPMLGALPVSALAHEYGAPLAVGAASVTAIALSLVFYLASPSLRGLDAAVRGALENDT